MEETRSNKKTLFDILKVVISNLFKVLSGVLVGFLLPKIVGVEDYGYYKTFTLYTTYIGILHLGIVDGIYLKFGGKSYGELEEGKFRFYSRFLFYLHLIMAILISLIALLLLPNELKFIFICLAIYMVGNNMYSYYQMISQITSRFNEYSIRTIIQSVLTTIAIVVLALLYRFAGVTISYRVYTLISVAIVSLLFVWYLFTYRKITFGSSITFKQGKSDIVEFMKLGIPLTIANLCTTLILTLDRQFVNIIFDTKTYAVYAFAYNMLTLVTTAISAISVVLYPTMKRSDSDNQNIKLKFPKLRSIILTLVFGVLVIYFPLCLFIEAFLPNYIDSLVIFRVIFPGLAISSTVTIVIHNFYKILNKNFNFFIKSLIVLVVSIIANAIVYLIFQTTISISMASIFTMIFWYILVESYFIKNYHVPWIKNFIYMLMMMVVFYAITEINNYYISGTLYLTSFIIINYGFNFKIINQKIKRLINKRNTSKN